MNYSDILHLDTFDDGVALVTLNRPDSRNALSAALRSDISGCLRRLEEDAGVRAVVLTGAGQIFCAGFDLKELKAGDASTIFAEAQSYHRSVHAFRKPLIAAVNGPAMAGGMDLALMCDVRLGCRQSQFGQPQVRMGIPASYDLVRSVIDEATARYLCLTGDAVTADDALRHGIISAICADREELQTAALSCAARIAEGNIGEAMKARFLAEQPALFD